MKNKEKVKKIIKLYKQDLTYLKYYDSYYPSHKLTIHDANPIKADYYYIKRIEKRTAAERRIEIIQDAKKHLRVEHYEIIDRDFIHDNDHYWYLEYYSRATYYRKRKAAIEAFIEYLSLFLEFSDYLAIMG